MITPDTGTDEVLRQLKVSPQVGLDPAEAERRLAQYGYNQLKAKKRKGFFQRFLDQFKNAMIIILIIAAVVSFMVALHEGGGFYEPILILIIVILNAIVGVVQENKAEHALQSLQGLSAPHARVLRDGKEAVIEAVRLVPGDIIRLEAGDNIPADARIIESVSLKAEEAALTGESVPSEKDGGVEIEPGAPLGDRFNMLFSGCSITYGSGLAVVTATGMHTEVGKIADLLESEVEIPTPLEQKLNVLGKYLGFLVLGICALILAIGLMAGMKAVDIFIIAVALAVSAIPEGLPAIITIVLAVGVQRMASRNAIVKRLSAVETLGSASVICSDKTGTLTQNQMTLMKAFVADTGILEDISAENSAQVKTLLQYATLCSDAAVEFEGGQQHHIGDPTETSIIVGAHKNGMTKGVLNQCYPRLAELPFDSARKLMSTVNTIEGKKMVIVKGAFDVIASRCTAGDVEAGRRYTEELGRQALRILAVAYKEIDEISPAPDSAELESDLTFMGLLGMIDPPRPEVQEAVSICRQAGIRPVMITGDHVLTASAIAQQLGMLQQGGEAITGTELAAMSAGQLQQRVGNIAVYARVAPADKIRIVQAWQGQGEVVAMTGDGVNDAPALKAADIGCAMGITGTDVSKGAADMILTDDNFATIVDAIREGRRIYDNIRKSVEYLLGTNTGEILTVFVAMLLWHTSPLLAVHLLWINLITDSLPAIALSMEAVEKDVMLRQPRPRDESIFAQGMGVRVILQGIMFAALTLFGFAVAWKSTGEIGAGRTVAFIVLALSQVFHSFNMRSSHSLFSVGFFSNRYLNWAALISIVLLAAITVIPPLAFIFGLRPLATGLYLLAIGLAAVPLLVLEISKALGLIRSGRA